MLDGDGRLSTAAVHAYRLLLVSYWEWACGWGDDPLQTGSPYDDVIERRHRGWVRGYSSCADLAHGGYESLGVWLPWVNRHHNCGWRMGRNIELLSPGVNPCSEPVSGRFVPQTGDVVVIANHEPPHPHDDHVVCVIDCDGDWLSTAEYGAAYPVAGGLRSRRIVLDSHRVRMASSTGHLRTVQCIVPLVSVLRVAHETGLLATVATEYLRP